ncbi:hypothetical protein F4810DRAFT_656032 [Camillea tinctor]|nr:hypothetical protein F4810DRAFT_656032 [Camillea tinctor]
MAKSIQKVLFPEESSLNCNPTSELAVRYGIRDKSDDWHDLLTDELKTDVLDDLYEHLWLVAKKEGRHIDSLHEHLLKKRTVTIAEHPKLHLVRYYDTIYLKPIPNFLLNHTVWSTYLCSAPGPEIPTSQQQASYNRKAALGYIRSYGFLIQHESDFFIAQQANLVPSGVTFLQFQQFIRPFRELGDDAVSNRYHYGQFRLTRLNFAVRVFRPRSMKGIFPWYYQEQYWQTQDYIQRFGAPLLFVFAILSLILSSMQVALAAKGQDVGAAFVQVSWKFSIIIIIFAACPIVIALLGVVVVLLDQLQFSLRMKLRESRSKDCSSA